MLVITRGYPLLQPGNASEIRVAMHIEIFQLLEGIPWETNRMIPALTKKKTDIDPEIPSIEDSRSI